MLELTFGEVNEPIWVIQRENKRFQHKSAVKYKTSLRQTNRN